MLHPSTPIKLVYLFYKLFCPMKRLASQYHLTWVLEGFCTRVVGKLNCYTQVRQNSELYMEKYFSSRKIITHWQSIRDPECSTSVERLWSGLRGVKERTTMSGGCRYGQLLPSPSASIPLQPTSVHIPENNRLFSQTCPLTVSSSKAMMVMMNLASKSSKKRWSSRIRPNASRLKNKSLRKGCRDSPSRKSGGNKSNAHSNILDFVPLTTQRRGL